MMMSPDAYAENIKDLTYGELVNERNRLIRSLQKFENNDITDKEKLIDPSPEVVYQCNNWYLIEVTKLLNDTYNLSLWS